LSGREQWFVGFAMREQGLMTPGPQTMSFLESQRALYFLPIEVAIQEKAMARG
jgi:hypothetical protein